MKSFVEQSERHYVSVPRHHLWSRIYIILRVSVSHICRVYVSVCISVCLRCVHVRVSVYYDTLVSSLLFSHSRPLTRILSLFPFSHPITPALSRSFRALSHIYPRTRSFRPPFSPSLSYLLTFRVRSPLFDILDSRISMGLNSTLRRETARNRMGLVIVLVRSRVLS